MPGLFKVPLANHTYTLVLSMWSFNRDRNKGDTETVRGWRGGTKIQMERKPNQVEWQRQRCRLIPLIRQKSTKTDELIHQEKLLPERSTYGRSHLTADFKDDVI